MFATELIGKVAIRTKPVVELQTVHSGSLFGGDMIREIPSYYHCTTPILILNATAHHIVYERYPKPLHFGQSEQQILDVRYCDGNWVDYQELIKPVGTDADLGFEVVAYDDPEVTGSSDFSDAGPGIDFKSRINRYKQNVEDARDELKGLIEAGVDFGTAEISPISASVYTHIMKTTEALKEAHPEAYESLGDVPDEFWKETPDPDCQSLPKDFLQQKEEE